MEWLQYISNNAELLDISNPHNKNRIASFDKGNLRLWEINCFVLSSQLIVRAGVWKELTWFRSWVVSPILPNLFLYYRETVSFKYIFPSLYGSASNILVSLTWSHRTITVSIFHLQHVGHSFLSLWPMSFKQYCKSWRSSPVCCLSSVSWSSKYFSPLHARKLQSYASVRKHQAHTTNSWHLSV